MNINTVGSILSSARQEVKTVVEAVEHIIEGDVQAVEQHVEDTVEKVVAEVKADVSRVVHSLKVDVISTGVDITLRLDHALGETKRIVINGQLTVEKLIAHLRSLSGAAND